MKLARHFLASAGLFGAWTAVAGPLLADGAHGRIEGDLAASFGAGATVGPRDPRPTIDLRLRYLSTVGVLARYEDGGIFGLDSEPARLVSGGFELRPLFFARWLTGHESGKGRLDLTIDSIGLELGAFMQKPASRVFQTSPGFFFGFGVETPIVGDATGLYLGFHGGMRFGDEALERGSVEGPLSRALYLSITVSWQQVFGAHIVDIGDEEPR